ncbi:MAG: ribosome assembly factor SBDS [Nitrososphaerota archaeon]
MSSKFTVARLTIGGERFEILVRPEEALNYKLGRPISIEKVLASDIIYSDASRGLKASSEKLRKYFKSEEALKVAAEILSKGELQITAEQRRRLIEEKRKQIVNAISRNFVDPQTGHPHPPLRVEQALDQAHVSIDPFKPAEEQLKGIVEKLRPILPLKSERLRLKIRVGAQYSSNAYRIIKEMSEVLKSEWRADGSLEAEVEIPPGVQEGLFNRLASLTKGTAEIRVEK